MKGVCFDKNKGKFKAYADVFGSRVTVGSTFASANEAALACNNFKNSIFNSNYPLATFLRFKFNISFNLALDFIAAAIIAYASTPRPSYAFGMTFPAFTVAFTKNFQGSPQHRGRSLLPPYCQGPISDIIFGRTSLRSSPLRYEDALAMLSSLASSLSS